ncbi:hypothetical protein ABK040_016719 [Willaertia magna]
MTITKSENNISAGTLVQQQPLITMNTTSTDTLYPIPIASYPNNNTTNDTEISSTTTRKKEGKGRKRKSHVETKHRKTFMSIDVESMRNCLHLNQKEAAKRLGVSLSTLKRRFYEMRNELGYDKWPFPSHGSSKGTSTKSLQGGLMESDEEESSEEEEMRDMEEESEVSEQNNAPIVPVTRMRRRRNSQVSKERRFSSVSEDLFLYNNNSNSVLDLSSGSSNSSFELTKQDASQVGNSTKRIKMSQTGFLECNTIVQDEAQNNSSQEHKDDFIYYYDDESEEVPQLDDNTTSDEEYLEDKTVKSKKSWNLNQLSKYTVQLTPGTEERDICDAALLLVAFKKQQLLSNALEC